MQFLRKFSNWYWQFSNEEVIDSVIETGIVIVLDSGEVMADKDGGEAFIACRSDETVEECCLKMRESAG
jgi:hypothetical protein